MIVLLSCEHPDNVMLFINQRTAFGTHAIRLLRVASAGWVNAKEAGKSVAEKFGYFE